MSGTHLVVLVLRIVRTLLVQQTLATRLRSAAVAAEVSLRVQFDEFVSLVAGVAAGQTNAGSLPEVLLRFRQTGQAGVQRLAFHVVLGVGEIQWDGQEDGQASGSIETGEKRESRLWSFSFPGSTVPGCKRNFFRRSPQARQPSPIAVRVPRPARPAL